MTLSRHFVVKESRVMRHMLIMYHMKNCVFEILPFACSNLSKLRRCLIPFNEPSLYNLAVCTSCLELCKSY